MLKDNSSLKKYLGFLLPGMFSMLVVSAYTFTDTFVVGQALGAEGLAAIGIGTPVLTALFAIGFLFGEGGGTAYSVLKGQGDEKKARQIYTLSILLAVFTGIIIIIFGNIFIYQLAIFLGAVDSNVDLVIEYIRCILCFSPIIILDLTTNNFMRNDGKPKVAMAETSIGSFANIVLDLLFVLVFKWGMFGASIATCLGSVIAVAINISYSHVKKRNLRFAKLKIYLRDVKRICANGFGPFVMQFSVALVTFFYNLVSFKYYGELGVSTYTIVLNWHLIAMNLIIGVSQGTQPLISLNHGKGDMKEVKRYRRYGLIACIVVGLLCLPTWVFGAEGLSKVFVKGDRTLVDMSVFAMKITSPTYVFLAITIITAYFYEATEKVKQSTAINLMRGCLMPALFVFVLPLAIGKVGVWVSIPLAEAISSIFALTLLIFTISKERKIVDVKGEKCSSIVITISREFGSGGRRIGEEVAKRLCLECYDKELPQFSAEKSGLDTKVVADNEETDGGCKFGLYKGGRYIPITDKIFYSQSEIIKQIARSGDAVIVGRCADYVLKDTCKLIKVFVYAPTEYRIDRITKYDGCDEKDAMEKIKESDKARKAYHDFYADKKWGQSENYDLVIKTEH